MKIPKEDLKNYVGKKIKNVLWDKDSYIVVTFVGNRHVVGIGNEDIEHSYFINTTHWETYEQPKQKVKMWQALASGKFGSVFITSELYVSEEHARKEWPNTFIKLLPHTEIEVEV